MDLKTHPLESREKSLSVGRLGACLVLVLATYTRFYGLTTPYLWYDEAFSVILSAYPPEFIWSITGRDIHPPLYYLLLHGWMEMVGQSVFAVRAFSAVAGIATVALGMWLMRLIASPKAALLAGLFLAFFPVAVRFSQEARMYAVLAVFLFGATVALVYWVKEPTRYRYLASYAVLMTASLYTHYYSVLCVLPHWLYLLLLRVYRPDEERYIARPAWWIANLSMAVLYIPWLFSLLDVITHFKNIQAAGSISWLLATTPYTFPSSIWAFLTLKKAHAVFWPIYWGLPLVIVIVAGWVTLFDRSRYKFYLLLGLYTFVPIVTLLLISLVVPTFMERYVVFAALGLPMILALAVIRVESFSPALAVIAVIAVLALETLGLKYNYSQQEDLNYPRNAAIEPFEAMGNYINQRAQPGDQIITDGKLLYFSAAYYNATGIVPMLYDRALSNSSSFGANAYGPLTLLHEHWDTIYLSDLAHLPAGIKRVWWLAEPSLVGKPGPFPYDWRPDTEFKAGLLELRLFTLAPTVLARLQR
ncbi:glycosyltransferase family 39 protein [Pseudomonas sp. MH10]|uniref:glycosyltransferase family 39 protein n=1 Tax=Pseudomonas sp. MH10 TaxID=3048627 RepID=UPI002AC8E55A|nr:glycosyltransferase family 39 protein [Pseudomonas sp. MH10]MEB0039706.1 glycosyltransferase family 39 protein [Pseudomonas sp. MH10]WPX63647.1 glycosyltransferase family 39 protein [Pseudomonas sp. MH10]